MNSILYQQIKEYIPYDEEEVCAQHLMLEFLQQRNDVLSRDNKIAHFTVSAWIVNPERTKILMVYHNIYKSWAWIGGHADGDADLFAVLQKEIREETGLKLLKALNYGICGLNVLAVESHRKNGKYVNAHLHFDVEYFFEADESQPVRIKEDENSAIGWIPINEIDRYVTEAKMKPVYAKLNQKLKQYS